MPYRVEDPRAICAYLNCPLGGGPSRAVGLPDLLPAMDVFEQSGPHRDSASRVIGKRWATS